MKKKKQPKTARKSIKKEGRNRTLDLLSLFGVIIFIAASYLVHTFVFQTRPVVESARTEMKKVPSSMQSKLRRLSDTAKLHVPILMYHYVENVQDIHDTTRVALNIPPAIFEEQIKTLSENNFTFLTAGDVGEILDGHKILPKNPIVLTVDDGHWDLATDILPILKKHNVKATAYIVPGFINGSDSLSESQMREVLASGLVEIGAHTVHHISLKGTYLPIVKKEVEESKSMLEKTYGIKVVSFAYPNGSFDEQAIKIVKEAGYTTAVSTIPGVEESQINRYFIYRIRPGRRTGKELLRYLQQEAFVAY